MRGGYLTVKMIKTLGYENHGLHNMIMHGAMYRVTEFAFQAKHRIFWVNYCRNDFLAYIFSLQIFFCLKNPGNICKIHDFEAVPLA